MGDRTGLPKLDRTNGYDDGRGYMKAKKSKLAQQNEEIREALRTRHNAMRTELFKGISINVNGRTQPTADELKRLVLLNGGEYHPYYRYQQTKFMIATNLSTARIKTLRPDDRIVKPEWITDSVKANCVLPYQDYQLFAEEPRGKNQSVGVITIDSDSSNQGQSNSNLSINSNSNSGTNQPRQQASIQQLLLANAAKKPESSSSSTSSIASETTTAAATQLRASQHIKPTKTTSAIASSTNTTKKQATMNDFVVRGVSRPSQQFPTPKVKEVQQRDVANIIGQTNIDDIVRLISEWVGCPEGIVDEDVACVTKYFYDLMSEKNYYNKFCEIFDAFRQRISDLNEKCWIDLYNDLARTFKNELSLNAEASQNLCQLITYINSDNSDEQ